MNADIFRPAPEHLVKEFENTFKMRFNRFYNRLFGFDIVEFDDVVFSKFLGDPATSGSLKDLIAAKYSDRAAALIEELISFS